MTPYRKKEIALAWNDLVRNLRKMEATCLALLRHPEASADDIQQVSVQYRDAYARLLDHEHEVFQKVANSYPLMRVTPSHTPK